MKTEKEIKAEIERLRKESGGDITSNNLHVVFRIQTLNWVLNK